MGSWRPAFTGRYSPFASFSGPTAGPPAVTEDDYHYLAPSDLVGGSRGAHRSAGPARSEDFYGRPVGRSSRPAPARDDYDADQPDVIYLKHRGTDYALRFPAYSIGEGLLRVGELRRAAAKELVADPRYVQLIYKGKILKDDAVACREEGLKQLSEVTCVVSQVPVQTGRRRGTNGAAQPPGTASSASASEDEMLAANMDGGAHRRERRRSKNHSSTGDKSSHRHSLVSPKGGSKASGANSTASNASGATKSSATHTSSSSTPGLSRASSTAKQSAASSSGGATGVPSSSTAPPTFSDPLDTIAHTLRQTFEPRARAFVTKPPADPKARQQEYLRITEGIMAQVINRLDMIEGDGAIRARRKALVQETQALLNQVDAVDRKV